MAKGIKAAPKKRKRKRLSEHARLVEERARSIPPGVVHELFDTSALPLPRPPPPAPARRGSPARFVSKPPPPPPRPSRAPGDGDAEAAELEELDELEEVDGSEESQTDGFGSHTMPPLSAPELGTAGAPASASRRSRALPAVLGALVVGALALATGRELGRSQGAPPRVAAKAPLAAPAERLPGLPSPPPPVADDLPMLPPGVTALPSSAPAEERLEAADPEPAPEATPAAAASASTPAASATALPATSVSTPAASASALARADMGGLPPFDAGVAEAAIAAAFQRAQGCRSASDPKGVATVTVTYAPSGRVTTALVSGVFAGTSAGSCIAAALRSARIAPFTGALVTVKRSAPLE